MIALAFVGMLCSRYLAAYQLGYIKTVWDPFFGGGTARVLTSEVSKMFPISDAGLGAAAYTIEMLMGWMGGKDRWRTMPWMVTFFFILVVPLGIVSIMLVMLQPLAVGAWCTICLFTALVMLFRIPVAVDEVIAMGQFLRASKRAGRSLWRTFWVGGTIGEPNEDKRTPQYGAPAPRMIAPVFWGVTTPWNLIASALMGIWLMFAPAVFGSTRAVANNNHLVGALVTTVAVITIAEAIRASRFVNVLLGLWIALAPWLLSGAKPGERWNALIGGTLLIVLSLRRGHIRERYAAWDRFIV